MSCESSPLRRNGSDFHLFSNTDFTNLENINNLITRSPTRTPVQRIISSSRPSSHVNNDQILFNTPSKGDTDHYQLLKSPSRRKDRKRLHHKFLRDQHHRKLRNQPSKLDMLDSGFTSFPIDPPEDDLDQGKKSMFMVEDYIEENRKLSVRKNKKISVLDFKRSLREQGAGSPLSEFTSIVTSTTNNTFIGNSSLRADFDQSSLSRSGQRSTHREVLTSNFSSASTVRDDFFDTLKLDETSSHTITNIVSPEDDDSRKICIICESELNGVPGSCFKELVCFECTEQYERLVNLINSDIALIENSARDDEDISNDEDEDDYGNLRPMNLSPSIDLPSIKRQCNDHDNVLQDSNEQDNFTKIYQSLKKIQDENNRLLILKNKRRRFHNPLLKVPENAGTRFNFNFNFSIKDYQERPRLHANLPTWRQSLEKFCKLTLINDSEEGDLWIRAKRLFNRTRQQETQETEDTDDNERYIVWT